jgi:ribosome-associated protein
VTNLQTSQRNIRELSLRRDDDVAVRAQRGDGDVIVAVALAAALEKKALEPVVLDVRGLCSYTDTILLTSARSDRQVAAIAENIRTRLKRLGHTPLGAEGEAGGQWALLDFGDAVVHVFHHPAREFYDLESLWADAKRVPIDVPSEARIRPDEY